MTAWGLNTYLYAPKDDLKQRTLWRELYTAREAEPLGDLIRACGERGLKFIYALSPGLDIRYANPGDTGLIKEPIARAGLPALCVAVR
jgi:protein O-GlcNAcase/histone acetyltransferase